MILAFQQHVDTGKTSVVADPDGDWDWLKIRMSKEWGIEKPFDSRNIWRRLRLDQTVLYNGHLYQVWDAHEHGHVIPELFDGHPVSTFDKDPDVD